MTHMPKTASFLLGAALCVAGLLRPALAQNNDEPPNQPFQAVHLIKLPTDDAAKAFAAALADINAAIAKAGCRTCVYHLWKVYGTQSGEHNYLWISTWPGRDVYNKIHNDAGYQAAINRHQNLNPAQDTQIYNRYVEVTSGK